jgi:starch-binding outer membrane protein, SusD/RagB family
MNQGPIHNNLMWLRAVVLGVCLSASACQNFLEQTPIGQLNEDLLTTKAGADGLLVGAYSLLDGQGGPGTWEAAASNWAYGGICGSDAYKGATLNEQPDVNALERFEATPVNSYLRGKWRTLYDGISRANDAISTIEKVRNIVDEDKEIFVAEARFLRGHYHFEAKKMWNNVPYIDETITIDYRITNQQSIWPQIEADFKYAFDNLPETQTQVGRANKWVAGAYWAKTLIFQGKFAEAKAILDDIVAIGRNANGLRYQLMPRYHDNFRIPTRNNLESVFEVQHSVNDGANGLNGGGGDVLNFPNFGRLGDCCGVYQPSQNLVNAFKTDSLGLPLVDTYNLTDVKNDNGLTATAPFVPHDGNLDPRLDWTVGRRGIPYLDWGTHPGRTWVFDQTYGGPYSPKKNVYYRADENVSTQSSGFLRNYSANNYRMIRFADVLLWAAECEVEVGSLEKAREYVNQVRRRASNATGFVLLPDTRPAAKYVVGLYNRPWTDKNAARKAVRFERRIELGMEGHRFFDLVRWGIADEEINAYLTTEQTKRSHLRNARFVKGKNEYFPIPQASIDLSIKNGQPTLKQNPGY